MAQEIINIGSVPNDGTGDPIRTAFDKVNNNFDELYQTGVADSSIRIGDGTDPNLIKSIDTNATITIQPSGTGKLVLDTNTVNIATSRTIANPLTGSPGDTAGDICWDGANLYVCVADYGTGSPVWKRAQLV